MIFILLIWDEPYAEILYAFKCLWKSSESFLYIRWEPHFPSDREGVTPVSVICVFDVFLLSVLIFVKVIGAYSSLKTLFSTLIMADCSMSSSQMSGTHGSGVVSLWFIWVLLLCVLVGVESVWKLSVCDVQLSRQRCSPVSMRGGDHMADGVCQKEEWELGEKSGLL